MSRIATGRPTERAATELLLNVVDALTLESSFERFFTRAAEAARRLVGGDGAALILINDAGRFEYQFFNGVPAERLEPFAGYQFPTHRGIAGQALSEGRSVFVPDYPSSRHAIAAFTEAGLRSNLVTPLFGPRGPVGALAVSWFHEPAAEPEGFWLTLVEKIAGQVSVAVQRRHLEQQLAAMAGAAMSA